MAQPKTPASSNTGKFRQPQCLGKVEIDIAADQQVGAVGEIEHAPDAENQREADGDQCIEPAQKEGPGSAPASLGIAA